MEKAFERKGRSKSRIAACFVVILLFALLIAAFSSSCSLFSSEIVLKNLDITVDIGSNGVITFTETMRAKFSDQDSDWWNFYRVIDDPNLLENMENFESQGFQLYPDSFTFDGNPIAFAGAVDLDQTGAKEMALSTYHSTVGYFFARPGKGVEIGVIMPAFSSGTHTISYSYSIKGDAVDGILFDIADATVFYYQYLSDNNTMDVEKMSVTVNFPQEEPELRSWLHTSQSGVGVWKQSDDLRSIKVLVEEVSAGEYVESRMLLGKGHYAAASGGATITSVDIEEEERAAYEKYQKEQRIRLAITILDYVLAVLSVGAGVLFIVILKRKNRPLDLPDAPIYYRDIPEGYTGGEVSPLYFYYSNENYLDESISATMLELVRLKYITIAPDEGKKNAVITVLKADEENELRTHQKCVIEMLLAVKPMGTSFTMKDFERFGKNHPERLMHLVEKYKAVILNKSQRDGAYQKGNPAKRLANKFFTIMVGLGIAVITVSGFSAFVFGMGMFFFGAGLLVGGLLSFILSKRLKAPLTVSGQREYNKLVGLSKYMQEFSLMKEHEIPALVLWEDYMIFATAMGIADKVAEQLEVAYPEFKQIQTSGFDTTDFMILYFFSPSFRFMTGMNFVGNISNIIRSVQIADRAMKAAKLAGKIGGGIAGGSGKGGGSSFHGGGGGFRGGGFGGRR
ncbi:MAG TPA: hypothetical protein DIC18_03610 [Clostridiales bacterium]|nr:hypothetical protein [Clostridiales bacterium]